MSKLNITPTVLDKLGFTEYWDEHGNWGGRTLHFKNGDSFRIIEYCEEDDNGDSYAPDGPLYVANHFVFADWFALPKKDSGNFDLYFLHEMYDCIKKMYPNSLEEFISKCRSVNMWPYLKYHIENTNNHE